MKLGIMQPYFFPYLGYWQLINAVDKYVVYDDVNYIKGGWISRNNILLNGNSHMITLPIDGASSYKLIKELRITENIKAREKVLRTICSAYNKAPRFDERYEIIERLILESEYISELNYRTVLYLSQLLMPEKEIILSSDLSKSNELKGQEKVIHIANILGCDTYINSIGGMDLYSKEEFKKLGIDLFFLKKDSVCYQQYNDDFIDNLSIIDVLMFNSDEEIREMLNEYVLI